MKTIGSLGREKLNGLDIPDGTKIEKVTKGGDNALKKIVGLLNEKSMDGYIRVRLDQDEQTITSYIILKESVPKLGLREVVTRDEKDPRKKVTKIFAGENTMHDVRKDSYDENAKIEVHSGVDVDVIIKKYAKEKKAEPLPPIDTKTRERPLPPPPEPEMESVRSEAKLRKDARKVGLFWGGKEDDETIEREVLQEKLKSWKQEGYDVSGLEDILSNDIKEVKAAFEKFNGDVITLTDMAAELELLSLAGFDTEVKNIKQMLKDPSKIPTIREEIKILENRAGERGEGAETEVCLVCGFPLKGEGRCPRCGAFVEQKAKKAEKIEGTALISGHCYIVEEEKLQKSIALFADVLGKGYSGFGIVRTNPKHLRSMKHLGTTTLIWLTDKESDTERTIPPVLERIMYEINDFIKQQEKACFILDGIEYLISSNNFDAVVRFFRRLVDEISESKSIFMVTVSPYTLKEQELKILEREMEKISFDDET